MSRLLINTQKTPKIFIVIPVFNRIELTKNCLYSLSRQTYKNYEIIVVDDNSSDGTYGIISRDFQDVTLLKGDGNLWWTGGTNIGVKYALKTAQNNDYVLTLNNDTKVYPAYLEHIISTSFKNPKSIIGSLCVHMDNPKLIDTSGFIMDWQNCSSRYVKRPGVQRNPELTGVRQITHTCGKGVLIPIQVFKKIGLFDQQHFPHYHADSAFTLKAHLNGFNVLLDYDSIVLSNVKTGGITGKKPRPSLIVFIKSLFIMKSPNQIKTRVNFAKAFFPNKKLKYLVMIYLKTIGGFLRYYFKYLLNARKETIKGFQVQGGRKF